MTEKIVCDKLLFLEEQIEELASFLLKYYPKEIGKGSPKDGQGACEMAVRILSEYLNVKDVMNDYIHSSPDWMKEFKECVK